MKADPDNNPSPLKAWVRALEMTAPIERNPLVTLPVVIQDLADQFNSALALADDHEQMTYRRLAETCNRYARWALKQGLTAGDVICLFMPNCPQYVAIWLGITSVGAIVALINTNLTGDSLAHAINIVASRHVIVGAELVDAFAAVLPRLTTKVETWVYGGGVRTSAEGAEAQTSANRAISVHHKEADGSEMTQGERGGRTERAGSIELTFDRGDDLRGERSDGFRRIDREIELESGDRLSDSEYRPQGTSGYRLPRITDTALYIYTSGTTGLPKAAKVSHFRLMQWSYWFAGLMDTRSTDRMLNCLPMYHSVGGVVAIGSVLVNGGSVIIRPSFSASRFWDEIAEWDCTLFQYIGELCRYLVNAPPHPREAAHRLRLCCGNGLRADVWLEFKRRFAIPQILEFYASTEGNVSLYNCEGKPGAIGRMPSFLAHRTNLALVKFDVEVGEPIRNQEGFCVRCKSDEIGETIGKIFEDGSNPTSRFEGYADREASEKKVLRNVFARGDAWFRTGDLMRRDDKGYFYFVDRVGDTFRWKGENVSTAEVVTKISAFPGVLEAIVYGVTIPGTEGRAGMVVVVAAKDFDLDTFHTHLVKNLPDYARPLFLRICDKIETTATFKSKTQELAREGYDPAVIGETVFFNDRLQHAFVKVDAALYERLRSGKMRL